MTKQAITNILRIEPFKPFALRLADGTLVPVPHPDFIALSEGGRTAIVTTGREDFEILDLGLVTAIESAA
jgi:hypothetical protein